MHFWWFHSQTTIPFDCLLVTGSWCGWKIEELVSISDCGQLPAEVCRLNPPSLLTTENFVFLRPEDGVETASPDAKRKVNTSKQRKLRTSFAGQFVVLSNPARMTIACFPSKKEHIRGNFGDLRRKPLLVFSGWTLIRYYGCRWHISVTRKQNHTERSSPLQTIWLFKSIKHLTYKSLD